MPGIKIALFGGVYPVIAPRLLPPHGAQIAKNCKLWNGDLRPWKSPLSIVTPTKVGTKKSIYRFGQDITNEAQYWFHWTQDVDCTRGPVTGDTAERTYFTGAGVPQVTDSSIALVGGTDYPMASYNLGVPIPANTPSVVVGGAGTGTPISKAYVYTYVTGWGEEGPPSIPSAVVSVQAGQNVTVGNMSTGPGAGYNVVSKRIYRTITGNNSVDYRFVAEVAVATVSYVDSIADATVVLNDSLATSDWIAPPTDMTALVLIENGIMAGVSGVNLCLSEPYAPSAWPAKYRRPAGWKIVGLGAVGQAVVVCTKGKPYVAAGVHPSSMTWDSVGNGKACVAKRSIASVGNVGVLYSSPSGMALVTAGGSSVATESLMSRDDWQALVPESINGYEYNGRYFGFYDTGTTQAGFILDPKSQHAPLTFTDVFATAGYNDPIRDTLYLQIGTDIKRWDGDGANNLSYQWKSSITVPTKPIAPSWAQVEAGSFPVTLKVYADGSLVHTQSVTSSAAFRLNNMDKAREFEVEITGSRQVKAAYLAETYDDLKSL